MNDIQKDICNLVSHMLTQDICTLVYRDRDNVTSVRYIRVLGIEKADNGHHFVRAYDTQRNAPRSFRIASIEAVFAGSPTLAILPHDTAAAVYEPAAGDEVRFHYTKWPHNCSHLEFSSPFKWGESSQRTADGMRRDGWQFTIEKVA